MLLKATMHGRAMTKSLSLEDFDRAARRRLPHPLYAYIAGAAEDNLSLGDNRTAMRSWNFVPRTLRDVSGRTMQTELFGTGYSAPIGIAPMGLSALMAFEGDNLLARAAANAKIPMILSGTSLIPLEEVVRHVPGIWFQAYLPGEAARIEPMIDRIAAAGIETLILTVDVCVSANRENLVRARFSTPLRPSIRLAWDGLTHPRWLIGTLARTFAVRGMPHFENSSATQGAPIFARTAERDFGAREAFSWEHARLIRKRWDGRLILKGILSADDARIAKDMGIDGVIVSNHGGRQLDGAAAPLTVLPAIVDAVGAMPVMIDSGFRRGGDVLKAIALGARMVFIGRPFLFAAAAWGEAGAAQAISLIKAEIDRNMALLGVSSLAGLDRSFLTRAEP
ncbi:(S)-2-hydroxy-acid oxidase (plasmid) [Sphingopyxis macrogoltabida]|nr:(S)-2-hydroxy-acid oxidase [Sphingopyxis macrogoltabida]